MKDLIKKILREGHGSSYMAKSQLYNIASKAQSMFDRLEKGEPLDDWMESKIAQMANMMNSVSDSFNYDEHEEKECPEGMYYCEEDKICKPDSQKMGEINITTDMQLNEIGFTSSYGQEALQHLDNFINVVKGPISDFRVKKSFPTSENADNHIYMQRLFQLLSDGGDLHEPTQELIDILGSLEDKQPPAPIGFRVSTKK